VFIVNQIMTPWLRYCIVNFYVPHSSMIRLESPRLSYFFYEYSSVKLLISSRLFDVFSFPPFFLAGPSLADTVRPP